LSVRADPDQIQQVLINLVKNASDALADTAGGRIVLRGARDGNGRVVVQVLDNGPGIDESQLSNIFVPFFTTALNKGLLSVRTALGKGCEFTLRFS
jgi:C4-dicarboxylate-specific signal transduction histidine kinase